MDDNRGVMFAMALLFFWLAGIALFTAFHPGGIMDPDTGDPAANPAAVVKFLMVKGGEGAPKRSSVPADPNVQIA